MKDATAPPGRDGAASVDWPQLVAQALAASGRRHRALRGRCTQGITAAALHDLRVETRRQLALVKLARDLGVRRTRRIRRSLRGCLAATSKLRDTDVQLERLATRELKRQTPGAFAQRLRRRARARARRAAEDLQQPTRKMTRRVRALAARVQGLAGAPEAEHAIARALQRAIRAVERDCRRAQRDARHLHEARLALKRLRYLAEALADFIPGITVTWRSALRRAQRTMGELHDLSVLAGEIRRQSARDVAARRGLRRLERVIAGRLRRRQRGYQPAMPAVPPRLARFLARFASARGRVPRP